MAEFVYKNAKNVSTGHTLFVLNCGYYPKILFKEYINSYSGFCSANKLAKELKELIEVYY